MWKHRSCFKKRIMFFISTTRSSYSRICDWCSVIVWYLHVFYGIRSFFLCEFLSFSLIHSRFCWFTSFCFLGGIFLYLNNKMDIISDITLYTQRFGRIHVTAKYHLGNTNQFIRLTLTIPVFQPLSEPLGSEIAVIWTATYIRM